MIGASDHNVRVLFSLFIRLFIGKYDVTVSLPPAATGRAFSQYVMVIPHRHLVLVK